MKITAATRIGNLSVTESPVRTPTDTSRSSGSVCNLGGNAMGMTSLRWRVAANVEVRNSPSPRNGPFVGRNTGQASQETPGKPAGVDIEPIVLEEELGWAPKKGNGSKGHDETGPSARSKRGGSSRPAAASTMPAAASKAEDAAPKTEDDAKATAGRKRYWCLECNRSWAGKSGLW